MKILLLPKNLFTIKFKEPFLFLLLNDTIFKLLTTFDKINNLNCNFDESISCVELFNKGKCVIFFEFIKYISNAANVFTYLLFLLCKICSPSIIVLNKSLFSVILPVNSISIVIGIKYIYPELLIYNNFLKPSALSVTI